MLKKGDMTGDKFEKQYSYNIRHMYGLEGKKIDYAPYSCGKIIQGAPPGNQEYHGCPFKHHDKKNLTKLLESYGVYGDKLDEVMKKRDEGHF